MSKKAKTFAALLETNKKAISKFYYKYIFLIIIFGTILLGIIFYKLGAHIVLFGDTTTALGEYVRTVATVLGGALVLLGLWINNRRVAEQTRQNNINERGQTNTRFKDAATLLGSDSVSSILSGIYALHQIALETSIGDKGQRGYVNIIQDILCAYVRENTDTIQNEENGKAWRINKKPTIVIQTIVKVLFKNDKQVYSNLMTDLSDCVLEGINLDESYIANVDFSRTKFIKSSFKNATFVSCYLEDAFIDEVDFSGSSFDKTVFDLSHIKNTSFSKGRISHSDFWNVVFHHVSFKDTLLDNIDFKDADMEDAVNFENTKLGGYSLDEIIAQSGTITKS